MFGMGIPRRDLHPIFFANFLVEDIVYDNWGNQAGIARIYTPPHKIMASVSPNRGTIADKLFGLHLDYDRQILIKGAPPIRADSLLWVDGLPPMPGDISPHRPGFLLGTEEVPTVNERLISHDYVLATPPAYSPAGRNTVMAIKRVNVTVQHYDIPIEEAPAGFQLVDALGRPLEDSVGHRLYVLGRQLADASGRLLEDAEGKSLVVSG